MQKDGSCSEDVLAARAAVLLDKWSALKEVYRIPKKASKLVRIKACLTGRTFVFCCVLSGVVLLLVTWGGGLGGGVGDQREMVQEGMEKEWWGGVC